MRKTLILLALLSFGLVGCADNYETDGGWTIGEQPPYAASYDEPRVDISGGGPVGYDRFLFDINYPKTSFCVSMLVGPFEPLSPDVQGPGSLELATVTAQPAGCDSADGPRIEATSARGRITFDQSSLPHRATIDLSVEFPDANGVPSTLRIQEASVPIEPGYE